MKVGLIFLLAVVLGACATKPAEDMIYAHEGFHYTNLGNFARAEAALNDAISVNPQNAFALLNLGSVYESTGRLERARTMYRQVIRIETRKQERYVAQTTNTGGGDQSILDLAVRNLKLLDEEQPVLGNL